MERNIVKWTYWLGIACTAVAFVWRGAVSFGVEPRLELPLGGTVGYEGFINGAVLFLLLAAATAGYLSMEEKR